jgi:hypothetical protein
MAFAARPRRHPSTYDYQTSQAGRQHSALQFGTNLVVLAHTVGDIRWGESVYEVTVTFTS